MRVRLLLVVSVAVAAGFAPAPLPRPDRGRAERPRLFGTWTLKQVRYVGNTSYSGAGAGTGVIYLKDEVTITDREMRVQSRDPNMRRGEQRMAIEATTGMPHLDFLQGPGQRTRGLYRVEGATLTIAYPVGTEKPRPTSFDNHNDIVLVFERVR
jgi:uncharacterized protein (TIGR03067 family)